MQGDDEQLSRTIAHISNNNQTENDWTHVKVILPSERVKVFIQLNNTNGSLAFDDLSIDYCHDPRPLTPKILFSCDFESSCSVIFLSLPLYSY